MIVIAILCVAVLMPSVQELQLIEVDTRPMHISALAGIHGQHPGLFAYWRLDEPGVHVVRSTMDKVLIFSGTGRIVGVHIDSPYVEVVDAERLEIVRAQIDDGDVVARTPIEPLGVLESAVKSNGAWYFASRGTDSRLEIRVARGSDSQLIFSMPRRERGPFTAHISSTSRGILVAEVGSPHRLFRVGEDGSLFILRDSSTAIIDDEPSRMWIALPAVVLNEHLLQVFADLKSDKRQFLIMRSDGLPVRRRQMEVPLGIVFASKNFIWGGRLTDIEELVVYRWRWANSDN